MPSWAGGRDPKDVAVRDELIYKARPLNGIWAVAPFLHNGSVPNLYLLLSPQSERPKTFWAGSKQFDPVKVGYDPAEMSGATLFDTVQTRQQQRRSRIQGRAARQRGDRAAPVAGRPHDDHRISQVTVRHSKEELLMNMKYARCWHCCRQDRSLPAAALRLRRRSPSRWSGRTPTRPTSRTTRPATTGSRTPRMATAACPLVLLRSLPDLAPDIWGKPDEQFARFGYLPNPGGPLPLGLSWDSMDPSVKPQPLHPVALTCGACHIGRVKLDDGTSMTLVGGPNTEFDVRMWRKAFELMVHQAPEHACRRGRHGRTVEGDRRRTSPRTISIATPAA